MKGRVTKFDFVGEAFNGLLFLTILPSPLVGEGEGEEGHL